MATFYNQTVKDLGDSKQVIFTSTSDSTIVLSILACNTDGTNNSDLSVQQDSSSDTVEAFLAFTIPVPADANLEVLSNKYILPSGKKLAALSSASGLIDLTVSYVEV
jgi:uncharacterized lipoprotein